MPIGTARASTPAGAEPAIRAVELAISERNSTLLVAELSDTVVRQARHRLERVLELKERAARDAAHDEGYAEAVADLRAWAADLYLVALRTGAPRRARAAAAELPQDAGPYTEEGLSFRRHFGTKPFPGQRGSGAATTGVSAAGRSPGTAAPPARRRDRGRVETEAFERAVLGGAVGASLPWPRVGAASAAGLARR